MAGLDIKDCSFARGNQFWLSGKQIFMPACPTDNQTFHVFVHIYYIGQVKISFGQPVLAFYLPDGQVVQKVNVEPWMENGKAYIYHTLANPHFFIKNRSLPLLLSEKHMNLL
jgi:hypothetical protein